MPILVLIVAGVFLALGAVAFYLCSQLSRAKGALFAANRDAARARARQETAKKAASAAQERCTQLVAQLDNSLASTGQALSVARHVEIVSRQLTELIECVAPLGEAEPGRHAVPGATLREVPETYTRELPHIHAEHEPSATSVKEHGPWKRYPPNTSCGSPRALRR